MMKWRRIQSGLRTRLAPTLSKRLDYHQARYRHTREEVGRVWIEFDGREIASFDTTSYGLARFEIATALREANHLRPVGNPETERAFREADNDAEDLLRRDGRLDDYRTLQEMEDFLSMSVETALKSESPLLRALAVLDGRVGKRRLRLMAAELQHPLVGAALIARCVAEGLELPPVNSRGHG
jgi:hypothetical protein